MLQKILATGLALLCLLVSAAAQDAATPSTDTSASEPNPAIFTCSADVYYRYDFAKTAGNNRTSFTNSHNSFELGMASFKAEHHLGNVGMVADLGFGKRAEEFSYADDRTRFAIKQLYLSYSFKNGVKITAGSWATHCGYELVDAYLNRNYSMSYMFSYGPFAHTGIKAEKTFGRTGIMLGVANPSDLKSIASGKKYLIGQLSTTSANEKAKAWLNYHGGKPNDSTRVGQLDLVLTAAVAEKFSIGLNGTVASYQFEEAEDDFGDMNNWWGTALYLNADPSDWLALTLRTEYFSDSKGLNVFGGFDGGGSVLAATLSLNLKSGNLTVIPEVRFEKASEGIFTSAGDENSSTSTSVLLAGIYTF
ncbi:MAG: porin [Bacteroidetes bacterium]|nr:porin [Bacteroidota bacterium]